MNPTIYDRIARYLLHQLPRGVLAWLLGLSLGGLDFVRWLDPHLGSPESSDRTADKLAHLANPADGGRPWVLLCEFQTRPDAEMFGRGLEYLGAAWRREKPSDLPGDRFAVAMLVVNLTGRGNSFPVAGWPEAGFASSLPGRDVDLHDFDAGAVLDQVEAGTAPIVVLAWIPLFRRGDDPAIMARWLEVARRQTDRRVRECIGFAQHFAELAGNLQAWLLILEDWTVTESPLMNAQLERMFEQRMDQLRKEGEDKGRKEGEDKGRKEGEDKGRKEGEDRGRIAGKAEDILLVLQTRFQSVPEDVAARVRATKDEPTLTGWLKQGVTAASLDAFRQSAGV